MYRRSGALLDRLQPHIFHGSNVHGSDLRAGLQSLWQQGIVRSSRLEYFRLLAKGLRRDVARRREARLAARELEQRMRLGPSTGLAWLGSLDVTRRTALIDRACEGQLRAQLNRRLEDVAAW